MAQCICTKKIQSFSWNGMSDSRSLLERISKIQFHSLPTWKSFALCDSHIRTTSPIRPMPIVHCSLTYYCTFGCASVCKRFYRFQCGCCCICYCCCCRHCGHTIGQARIERKGQKNKFKHGKRAFLFVCTRFGIGALENAKQTIASMTTTNLTHGSHFIRTRQNEGFFVHDE